MRVLFSFVGGAGHLIPQLPLAAALASAGHELTLVGRGSAVGYAPSGLFARVVPRRDVRMATRVRIAPIKAVDVEAEIDVVARHFAGAAAEESARAVAVEVGDTDLVLCDEMDFGAMAAADRAGIPVAVVAVTASGALVRPDRIEAALLDLRARMGLSGPMRLRGDLFVIPFATALRDPRFPAPGDAVYMRADPGAERAPDGSILATLGTEFNSESGDLFRRIVAGLSGLDAPVRVAVGDDIDPSGVGAAGANVAISRRLDMSEALSRAGAVISHGGSGLVSRCVLAGVPQVVLPLGADQPFNAERVDALGIGTVLNAVTATPEEIRAAILGVLGDEEMRGRISAVRLETLALPDATSLVARLEALAE